MAVNTSFLGPRMADRKMYLAAAVGFPLIVLIGYFRSYYGSALFSGVPPLANWIVHLHGVVMTSWVVYFTVQVTLIRTKNIKLHMTLGLAGVVLAAIVIMTGTLVAYNAQLVRGAAPPGVDPRAFFLFPMFDMLQFAILFTAAIVYRKKSATHKSLMLLTAINFIPAALFRLPAVPPDRMILWAFGTANLLGLLCFAWHSWKHRKVNVAFAAGLAMLIVTVPLRIWIGTTDAWLSFASWLAGA